MKIKLFEIFSKTITIEDQIKFKNIKIYPKVLRVFMKKIKLSTFAQ